MASSGAYAQEETTRASGTEMYAIGAALAIGLAAIGAGYGIAHGGAAAIGAIAEKPETATWGLIIVALAEGVALYGLIIAFLLVTKI
ncbi:MAG: ATPase [Candidatus Aenigmarchaeota archaeon]|nr:ATPase [Candidatus Aenigmarchaeota archaeon]